jgi:hypothetical protein
MGYERAVVIDSDICFVDNFNADELFKGALFDIRAYQTPMPEKKVKLIYDWGKGSVPTNDPMGMSLGI